ncbi:MAG: family 78 glycoside hydrolase catalytic domain [Armatimonadota bacterium]|nr:glycoside hydrolase family 78 protein [bacterium]
MNYQWSGHWIWTTDKTSNVNAFVKFRRVFDYTGGPASIHITADSRYVLYINGEWIGQGPVRDWPSHWRYDEYDIAPHLSPGKNVVAVLVNHWGEGNFQYIPAAPGLLAKIEMNGQTLVSDSQWRAVCDNAYKSSVPRVSVQEAFEEQFDARQDDGWRSPEYDDSTWPCAVELRPSEDGEHSDLSDRAIPFLTMEPVLPARFVSAESVGSLPYIFTLRPKPYIVPGDVSSNMSVCHFYIVTQIWSPSEAELTIAWRGNLSSELKLNGELVNGDLLLLKPGWNSLVVPVFDGHSLDQVVCFDGPEGLRFCSTGDQPGSSWAVVGPFELNDKQIAKADSSMDDSLIVVNPASPGHATGEAFWDSADVSAVVNEPFFQQIVPEYAPDVNVFAQAYTDFVTAPVPQVDNPEGLLSGSEWTTVHPAPDGCDVRLLLDFGAEVVGYHAFEITASAGTIVDFHNFEFIQPDGRYNFAEGMNNSFRYICRDGRQSYKTYLRRGFRYSYMILRNLREPVKLKGVKTLFCTYPQSNRGSFASSDALLNRIWKVGAHTLRCCSEDTYTDCPTYEQTNWVGDARNEALIDWVINGDPRLWFRCLEQTGNSMERSAITESHVPSAWVNILPAWSFLWMRSCCEYLIYTGDIPNSRKLLAYIERNIEGVEQHLDSRGLFSIHAWNMFDWAAMDTPNRGVVTHNNCFAVLALNTAADMADTLERPDLARKWRAITSDLSDAINAHLWNEEAQAYTDCLRGDEHSPVFSQQTQTVAMMSGVAQGARAERCRDILHNPPDGFVKAGSPFFEFFLLEALQEENRVVEFLDTIRRDWGFMVEKGSTTFWEMWSCSSPDGRLTRSHCHGWSAAPTFFLSSYVVGVKPGGIGFSPVIIEPHPGDLTWCRGTVPTPAGDISVQWENTPDQPFTLRVQAPAGSKLDIKLPREGSVQVNGQMIETTSDAITLACP